MPVPVVLPAARRAPGPEEEAGLRLVVAGLARTGARRRLPTVVHAGRPAGVTADFLDRSPASLDAGLRTDVASALLSRALTFVVRPAMWVCRSGDLVTEDPDLQWYAAARAAYAEAAQPLLLLVVTRQGWYDPGSGLRREWRRLRLS